MLSITFMDLFLCYFDQTEGLKQRTKKQKSEVTHPNNSTCKKMLSGSTRLQQNKLVSIQNFLVCLCRK